MKTSRFLNRAASSFLDYAIILSIIGMALGAMNIYIKRGVQGRMKLFSDNFLGPQMPGQDRYSTSASRSDSTRNQAYGSAETVNETSNSS